VRKKHAAEELIDQWTVQFLSGQNAKIDPGTFKTVEQAIQDYLDEKRGTRSHDWRDTPAIEVTSTYSSPQAKTRLGITCRLISG